MNFIYLSNRNNLPKNYKLILDDLFGAYYEINFKKHKGVFLIDKLHFDRCNNSNDNAIAYIQGYVRKYNENQDFTLLDHNETFTDTVISKNTELYNHFSGAFSSIVVDNNTGEIFLNTDWVGFYPIYYNTNNNNTIVSSSLIAMGAFTNVQIDEVGVLQRITVSSHYNYGRRTILKEVKRLMGGEHIYINPEKNILKQQFFKGLFNVNKTESLTDARKRVWKTVKKEFDLALKFDTNVNMAQSSGVDSRLAVASIPKDKKITCYIYGDNEYYEVRLAKKVAKKINAAYKVFPVDDYFFVNRKIMEKYVKATEGVEVNNWLGIYENVPQSNEVLILGDLCEAFNGRYIKEYRSKKKQVKLFISEYILNKEIVFTDTTNDLYEKWKKKKRTSVFEQKFPINFDKWSISKEDFLIETEKDLEENFKFIEHQNVPYTELLDEALGWHTSRAKQVLLSKYSFFPMAPMTAVRIMQIVSSVNPRYRLNYKLIHNLFRNDKDLKKLSQVPTAQIPLVNFRAPNYIKLPIWGIRGFLDAFFLKRMMYFKNPNMRDLTVNWIRFPKIYQRPEMQDAVNSWFAEDEIKLKEVIFDSLYKKKAIIKKPIYTFHETCMAALNIKMNLINKYKKMGSISNFNG